MHGLIFFYDRYTEDTLVRPHSFSPSPTPSLSDPHLLPQPHTCSLSHTPSPSAPHLLPQPHTFSLSPTSSPSDTQLLPQTHTFSLRPTLSPSLKPTPSLSATHLPPQTHTFSLSHTLSPSSPHLLSQPHTFSLSHTPDPHLLPQPHTRPTPSPSVTHLLPQPHTFSFFLSWWSEQQNYPPNTQHWKVTNTSFNPLALSEVLWKLSTWHTAQASDHYIVQSTCLVWSFVPWCCSPWVEWDRQGVAPCLPKPAEINTSYSTPCQSLALPYHNIKQNEAQSTCAESTHKGVN